MANWARAASLWFSLDTMPSKGPVLLTDETETIQWLVDKPDKASITHQEHARDDAGHFLFETVDGQQRPVLKVRSVKPALWCPVVTDG